jgi:hypothetical protein
MRCGEGDEAFPATAMTASADPEKIRGTSLCPSTELNPETGHCVVVCAVTNPILATPFLEKLWRWNRKRPRGLSACNWENFSGLARQMRAL